MKARHCQEYYLPVQTKGFFFVHRPMTHLERDRSPNIHLCYCSSLPTPPGPLALFHSNNNSVGEKSLGVGRDADSTKAELKAAPQREEPVPGQWAWAPELQLGPLHPLRECLSSWLSPHRDYLWSYKVSFRQHVLLNKL